MASADYSGLVESLIQKAKFDRVEFDNGVDELTFRFNDWNRHWKPDLTKHRQAIRDYLMGSVEAPPSDFWENHSAAATDDPLEPGGNGLVLASDLLDEYVGRLLKGDVPQLLLQSDALDGFEVGPGLITVVGAPPGAGKTALVMQVLLDALEKDPSLVGYILNAEMSYNCLMSRELTRMTGIAPKAIRFGQLTEVQQQLIREAASAFKSRLRQVRVVGNEIATFGNLNQLLSQPPGVIVVDYVQKFVPADADPRLGVNQVMGLLRQLASKGHAVLCVSATKRGSGGKHTAENLDLASFRESGEIEFNADSCYVLRDQGSLEREGLKAIMLSHLKNRHGPMVDHPLVFDMPRMTFRKRPPDQPEKTDEFVGSNPFESGVL